MTAPALYGIRYVLRSTSTHAPIQAIFSLFSSQFLPACRSLFGFRCYLSICSDCGGLNWEIGGFMVHRSEVVEQKNMPACLLACLLLGLLQSTNLFVFYGLFRVH